MTDDFVPVQLAYLGCADAATCPNAAAASPNTWVDDTDPPFFVAHSTDEMIPLAQAELFVRALRDAGVDTTFVTVTGTLHSIAMIDATSRSASSTSTRRRSRPSSCRRSPRPIEADAVAGATP